jgi:hypothetical protein
MEAMKQDRDEFGKFKSDSEPIVSKLSFRLPPSLRAEVERIAGDQIAAWLREAVVEKLEREKARKFY